MCAYCRTFIPNYAFLEKPLRALTTGKGLRSCDKINWSTEAQDAFANMKLQLAQAPTVGPACAWKAFHPNGRWKNMDLWVQCFCKPMGTDYDQSHIFQRSLMQLQQACHTAWELWQLQSWLCWLQGNLWGILIWLWWSHTRSPWFCKSKEHHIYQQPDGWGITQFCLTCQM